MQKEKPQSKADKMVKPNSSIRQFNFPKHNITIEASSIRDAEAKLEILLKSKSKNDD